jgi:hypothetical protein
MTEDATTFARRLRILARRRRMVQGSPRWQVEGVAAVDVLDRSSLPKLGMELWVRSGCHTILATVFSLALLTSSVTASSGWVVRQDEGICFAVSKSGLLQFEVRKGKLHLVLNDLDQSYWYDETIDVFYHHVFQVQLSTDTSTRMGLEMFVYDYGTASDRTVVSLIAPLDDKGMVEALRSGHYLEVRIGIGNPAILLPLDGSRETVDALIDRCEAAD